MFEKLNQACEAMSRHVGTQGAILAGVTHLISTFVKQMTLKYVFQSKKTVFQSRMSNSGDGKGQKMYQRARVDNFNF